MRKRNLVIAGLSIGAGLMLLSLPKSFVAQQAPAKAPAVPSNAPQTTAKPATAPYKQPMTSWGEPDISGMWPINHLVNTDLQRNARYGDRAFLTDEEFAAAQKSAEASQKQKASGAIPSSESGAAIRQTGLIVDPPNGQFPPLTDYGKQLQAKMESSYKPDPANPSAYKSTFDGIEDFGPWDRCITRGLPVSMEPRNYNNGIRITQAPGYVIITTEMAHESRVIPTTPQPRLDPSIREWLGESRGHWEGNTLIVETTNFNGLTELTSAGVPGSPRPLQPSTPNMKITERFKRTATNSMDYSIKVEDPTILATGSFTVAYPMMLDNSYQMYEYACHEGNTAIRNYIETYRYAKAHPQPAAPAGAGRGGGGAGGRGGQAPAGGGGRGQAPPAGAGQR